LRDTVGAIRHARAILMVSLLAAFARPAALPAEPRELPASVVWARGVRACVVAPDSGALEPGLRLTFLDRRRSLATGEITGVADGTLAAVRLTEGSLDRVKKLDRLRILAERPAAPLPPPVASLRVGVPSPTRANLVFGCPWMTIDPRFRAASYRVESLGGGEYRCVKISAGDSARAAPDTLRVRQFGDAVDEEIALARGDLDVAVFWPGELSRQMREDPRWLGAPRGLLERGAIATIAPADSTRAAGLDSMLVALDQQMFGGDLLPWAELGRNVREEPVTTRAGKDPRYAVDAGLPGQRALARFLNRGASPSAVPGRGSVRLSYLDVPLAARDSLAADWRARGVTPIYALRCPVLSRPERRELVKWMGVDAFANLPGSCGTLGRRP
jgi:hypothetical protein